MRLKLLDPFKRRLPLVGNPAARGACPVADAGTPSQPGQVAVRHTGEATADVPEDLFRRLTEAMEEVRPAIRMDGGDIELVGFEAGVVTVRLQGACRSCPMSEVTLQLGVERVLKSLVPEVIRLEAI